MKKLMVAAAAFAMAFATLAADCCGCENTCGCSTDCVYAYEFILLAKSTEGKQVQKTVKSTCACECDTVCGSCCFRKPRMRKYAGFVAGITNGAADEEEVKAGCGSACTCFDFVKAEPLACACGQLASLDDYVGDNNVWGGQYFWDVRTKKAVNAALWFYQLDAIGYQSRETVEAVGNFALELDIPAAAEEDTSADEGETKIGVVTLAGFGKRGKRGNGVIMVKNISGFFAGQLPVRCYDCAFNSTLCGDTCTGSWALAWTVCSDKVYAEEGCGYGDAAGIADPNAGLTAAYGKWTLKWNATAAAKLTKSYAASTLVKPGYESHSGKAWFKELTGAPEEDGE